MSCDTTSRNGHRDLVAGWSAIYLWIVPAALILLGALLPAARVILWIPSFALMGLSCVINARRCGRLHCHATGPLFLGAALVTSFDALGMPLLPWKVVLSAVAAGTVLAFAAESLRGRYVGTAVS
jgi:hypothetical protein